MRADAWWIRRPSETSSRCYACRSAATSTALRSRWTEARARERRLREFRSEAFPVELRGGGGDGHGDGGERGDDAERLKACGLLGRGHGRVRDSAADHRSRTCGEAALYRTQHDGGRGPCLGVLEPHERRCACGCAGPRMRAPK